MELQKFEKLVTDSILDLPKQIRKEMDNVVVCIELRPSLSQIKRLGTRIFSTLLGLYEGVPKTVLGRNSFPGRLPDKITIFQKPIEDLTQSEKEIKELVRIVVWHEIAHHFGLSEKTVRILEDKWRQRRK